LCHTILLEANYIGFLVIVNTLQGMKNLGSKIAGWVIWILIALLGIALVKDIQRSYQIKEQVQAEKDKVVGIQAENNKLMAELTQTQNPDFIEKEIRNQLGLGKAGEAIVVLPDDDTLKKLAPQVTVEADTLPPPNWEKWEKLFF